jgi:hypothetical protein
MHFSITLNTSSATGRAHQVSISDLHWARPSALNQFTLNRGPQLGDTVVVRTIPRSDKFTSRPGWLMDDADERAAAGRPAGIDPEVVVADDPLHLASNSVAKGNLERVAM